MQSFRYLKKISLNATDFTIVIDLLIIIYPKKNPENHVNRILGRPDWFDALLNIRRK